MVRYTMPLAPSFADTIFSMFWKNRISECKPAIAAILER